VYFYFYAVVAAADDITLVPVMSADGIGVSIALVLLLQVGKPPVDAATGPACLSFYYSS
jgi:hypothetical protein